jgi:hypothetical protein
MTFAELKADMIARGLVILPSSQVGNTTQLPDNQGTFQRHDVPAIHTTADGYERKSTQAVHVYDAGGPGERAAYADRIVKNEAATAEEIETNLEKGRKQLKALIDNATPVTELGGAVIESYRVLEGQLIGQESAVRLQLSLVGGQTVDVWATRGKQGDLQLDPA